MEAVIFAGIQGSGKSSFYLERFFHSHVRINLDMLKTRHREQLLLRACLAMRQPFVVDNSNVTVAERARYIAPARESGFAVTGYYFDTIPADAVRRNATRTGSARVPPAAIFGTSRRLQIPTYAEGFDRLYRVRLIESDRFEVEELNRPAAED